MFCAKCGKQLSDTVVFCKYCGALIKEKSDKVSDMNAIAQPQVTQVPVSQVKEDAVVGGGVLTDKQASRFFMPLLVVLVLAVIALGGGYFALGYYLGPKVVVNNYSEAITAEDYSKAYAFIDFPASDFIDEKSFASFASQNPDIAREAKAVSTVSKGTKYLLFKEWRVVPEDFMLCKDWNVTVPEGSTLYVNGKKVSTIFIDKSSQAGPFDIYDLKNLFPVSYELKAVTLSGQEDSRAEVAGTEASLAMQYAGVDSSSQYASSGSTSSSGLQSQIEAVLYQHYSNIPGDLSAAFNCFSNRRKQKYSTWGQKGFNSTIKDEVTNVNVTASTDTTAKVDFTMTSWDRAPEDSSDQREIVKVWEGTWGLVYEQGEWKLDNQENMQKIQTTYE